MSFILSVLLFFLLYSVGVAAWRLYTVYRKVREATRQFRNFGGARNSSAYGNNGKQGNTYGGSSSTNGRSNGGSSYDSSNRQRTTTTSSGDVVEDRRSEYEINRKIFTKEEGEYVDFEEL